MITLSNLAAMANPEFIPTFTKRKLDEIQGFTQAVVNEAANPMPPRDRAHALAQERLRVLATGASEDTMPAWQEFNKKAVYLKQLHEIAQQIPTALQGYKKLVKEIFDANPAVIGSEPEKNPQVVKDLHAFVTAA